jgi:hypothetical protein
VSAPAVTGGFTNDATLMIVLVHHCAFFYTSFYIDEDKVSRELAHCLWGVHPTSIVVEDVDEMPERNLDCAGRLA